MGRYARGGAAGAFGQGLMNIGDLLMSSGRYNDEQERLEAERAYRESRDQATDQYRADQMDYRQQRDQVADNRYREGVQREAQGQMRDLRTQGFQVHDATPSLAQTPTGSDIGGLLMRGESKTDRTEPQFAMGDYDPTQDVSVRRAGALDDMRTENDIRAAGARAGLSGSGEGGSTSPDYDEVGYRQRVLGAAQALADIDPSSPSYMGNPEADTQRVLQTYGFESVDDVSRAMQGIGPAPQPETPASGPSFEIQGGPTTPAAPRLQGPQASGERPGIGERVGNFLSDVNPFNKEGAAAEEQIPAWFRDQHPTLVEQGAPEDIGEAWRQYQGGA